MDENGFGRLTDLRSSDQPCRIPDGFKGWISPYEIRNPDGTLAEYDFPPRPPRKKPMSLPRQMPVLDDAPPVETVPSVSVPSDLPDLKAMIPADGKITVVEVEELVPTGTLKPDEIHLPGIYVHRIVHAPDGPKYIEKRTITEKAGV
jgi:hypothetical protein